MNAKKTQFQEEMSNMEQILADYKNAYPQNVGALVRRNLANFMLALSILLFVYSFTNYEGLEMGPCMIAPVLFVFAGFMYTKDYGRENRGNLSGLTQSISQAKEKYKEYPDVQNYIQKYEDDFHAEYDRKSKIQSRFKMVFWGIVIGLGAYTAYGVYDSFSHYNDSSLKYNKDSNDKFRKILDLKTNEPFLVVKPLRTQINDSLELDGSPLNVFFDYFQNEDDKPRFRALVAPMPKFKGKWHGKETLRLFITDLDGKPIKRCPGFWFVAKFDNDDIQSRSFSFGFDTREQNEFQMTQTLRYLQDHKDSLRFVVENVWCDIAAKYNQ